MCSLVPTVSGEIKYWKSENLSQKITSESRKSSICIFFISKIGWILKCKLAKLWVTKTNQKDIHMIWQWFEGAPNMYMYFHISNNVWELKTSPFTLMNDKGFYLLHYLIALKTLWLSLFDMYLSWKFEARVKLSLWCIMILYFLSSRSLSLSLHPVTQSLSRLLKYRWSMQLQAKADRPKVTHHNRASYTEDNYLDAC